MPRYVPEPVPAPTEDGQPLRRYIDVELRRISEALNLKVDRAFGGLSQSPGVVVITPLDSTFILFEAFDTALPARPDGVDPSIGGASLTILSGGIYNFSFSTSVVAIGNNNAWSFFVARNGVSTGFGGEIDPSNQTDTVIVGFSVIAQADRGDVFTIIVNSPSNDDLSVRGSEFIAQRISETHD